MRASSKPFLQSPLPLVVVLLLLGAGFMLYFSFFSAPSRLTFSVDSIENCRDLNRSSYSISPSVFVSLPSPPACFDSLVSAFHEKRFVDVSFFDSSYYLQPEFYPTFLSEGLRVWKNPDGTHYGVVGFGSYPSSSVLSLRDSSTVHFFVYSGFGVRSVQSVSLRAEFENPSDADFFSVSFDDVTSRDFLLAPNFPKFHPGWVHPVTLTIVPRAPSPNHSVVVRVHTVRSQTDFSADALSQLFPLFDSTDYVGEKVVYQLVLNP